MIDSKQDLLKEILKRTKLKSNTLVEAEAGGVIKAIINIISDIYYETHPDFEDNMLCGVFVEAGRIRAGKRVRK